MKGAKMGKWSKVFLVFSRFLVEIEETARSAVVVATMQQNGSYPATATQPN